MVDTLLQDLIGLSEYQPDVGGLLTEIMEGLRRPQKELPSKLFYDQRGSELFNQICQLEEYYLTRIETTILETHIDEIADLLCSGSLLLEYGSGSSRKTRILLDHFLDLAAYMPIDISREQLLHSSAELAQAYPGLTVLPVWADYTGPFELPASNKTVKRRVAFFPGSSIGNFRPVEAINFLRRIAATVDLGGGLLIGVDLKKDPQRLHLAYNDHAGVTAEFNLNLLLHMNRRFGADFQVDQFRHYAFYNPRQSRIEMHLVSMQEQLVHLNGCEIYLKYGESILTEVSYKYTYESFAQLAARGGFRVERVWTDPEALFSVQYLLVR